ncbi:STAS domain-containing protein [Chloroflexus sp.]|uniref:STAS domain-containing protein n=1 Tax=Chloroflexus sp. TaxID=1904827 RepID=UPI00298F2B97|nr:STAS domain-containing protein [Chloroflexus sp.]MDW8403967.1 STAS domain-containing protein [Chloroflexus sp.]
MTTIFTELQDFLLARRPDMLAELAQRVQQHSAGYAGLAQEELLPTMSLTIEALAEAIGSQDSLPFVAYAEALGEMRAHAGFILTDVLVAINAFRALTWDALEAFAAQQPACTVETVRIVEDMLGQFQRAMVTSFSLTYNQLHFQLLDQAEQIAAQQQTIRELSTPILPLYQNVLVLPLIGAIDSFRAGQMMERLLTAISERQSDIVIIDITGVPVIDTAVANYLLQTARAAQLIGAQVIMVGIGPEIAQTIVQLGVDLSRIAIGANLQTGIELALRFLGKRIVRRR